MRGKRLQLAAAITVVLLVLAAGLHLLHVGFWETITDLEALEQWVRAQGAWGPGAIVLGEILQVLLAPVPGQVVGIVAGYLYGAFWGTLLCMIGLAVGTVIAIWVARRLGRPVLETVASKELVERVDGYARRRGALALFLIFLLPFLPDDVCCFIAGLTPLRIGELLILAIVGRAPGVIVSTLIGAQARNLTWPQMVVIGVASAVLFFLFVRYQDTLERTMFGLLDRFTAGGQRSEIPRSGGQLPGHETPDPSGGEGRG